jgi:hypothetical protein
MADFELKPIPVEAIPEALHKAELYRWLNEPEQAESICRDILRARADDQQALVLLVLAMTDQFASADPAPSPGTARQFAGRLLDLYQRAYYTGLICERHARALMTRGLTAAFAYDGLREAMELYEQAIALSSPDRGEAVLRWNSCVRTIRRYNLKPRQDDRELLLE